MALAFFFSPYLSATERIPFSHLVGSACKSRSSSTQEDQDCRTETTSVFGAPGAFDQNSETYQELLDDDFDFEPVKIKGAKLF